MPAAGWYPSPDDTPDSETDRRHAIEPETTISGNDAFFKSREATGVFVLAEGRNGHCRPCHARGRTFGSHRRRRPAGMRLRSIAIRSYKSWSDRLDTPVCAPRAECGALPHGSERPAA